MGRQNVKFKPFETLLLLKGHFLGQFSFWNQDRSEQPRKEVFLRYNQEAC